MMRIIIISFFIMCFGGLVKAQTWIEVGGLDGLDAYHNITATSTDSFGNVYATGNFTNSLGSRFVSKFDGLIWSELGGLNSLSLALNGAVGKPFSLCSDKFGNIFLLGDSYVVEWNGTAWIILGGLNPFNQQITRGVISSDNSGGVYVAGSIKNSSNSYYVAKWDGLNWTELGGINSLAANSIITALCTDCNGNVYVGGDFTNSKGNKYVAKYNGLSWTELGGLNSLAANSYILALCVDKNNNIYTGGNFTKSFGHAYVAKFDGSAWNDIGTVSGVGISGGKILSLTSDACGSICATTEGFDNLTHAYVGHLINNIWIELGGYSLMANGVLNSLCSDKLGNVYAGGEFTNNSGHYYVATCSAVNVGINNPSVPFLQPFPNPSTNEITINNPSSPQSYSIRSINGQLLNEGKLETGNTIIDVSNYASGIYLLQTPTANYKFSVAH